MTNQIPSISVESKSSPSMRKCILLNGLPAIDYRQYTPDYQGSSFSIENTLVVVLKGELQLNYGSGQYLVGQNQMAFLKRSTMIEYQAAARAETTANVEIIFFTISYELAKEYSRLTQLPAKSNSATEIAISVLDSNMRHYITSLTYYLEAPTAANESLIKLKLLELLFCLSSNNQKILEQLMDLSRDFRPDITATIESHLMDPISINQLAFKCGRSLSSFRRDFLSIYKMPPSQWIREKRLKKAGELLLNTRMPVTEICYTLGFENIAHFSRLFKSKFGRSPSEYRLSLVAA